jgi:hypothetical protein
VVSASPTTELDGIAIGTPVLSDNVEGTTIGTPIDGAPSERSGGIVTIRLGGEGGRGGTPLVRPRLGVRGGMPTWVCSNTECANGATLSVRPRVGRAGTPISVRSNAECANGATLSVRPRVGRAGTPISVRSNAE